MCLTNLCVICQTRFCNLGKQDSDAGAQVCHHLCGSTRHCTTCLESDKGARYVRQYYVICSDQNDPVEICHRLCRGAGAIHCLPQVCGQRVCNLSDRDSNAECKRVCHQCCRGAGAMHRTQQVCGQCGNQTKLRNRPRKRIAMQRCVTGSAEARAPSTACRKSVGSAGSLFPSRASLKLPSARAAASSSAPPISNPPKNTCQQTCPHGVRQQSGDHEGGSGHPSAATPGWPTDASMCLHSRSASSIT